jgi:hypothetical protein
VSLSVEPPIVCALVPINQFTRHMRYTTSKNYGSEKIGMRMGGNEPGAHGTYSCKIVDQDATANRPLGMSHRVCVALLCLLIHVLGL